MRAGHRVQEIHPLLPEGLETVDSAALIKFLRIVYQRKFVRWVAVYVALAWVFESRLESLGGTYEWPKPILRLIPIELLVIGTAMAAVIAWYHGERAARWVSRIESLILVCLLIIGLGIAWQYLRAPAPASDLKVVKTPHEIYAEDAPSVVKVQILDAGQDVGSGSGVVIAKGEVITNCHVAQADKTLLVEQGGDRYPATIHYADRKDDLCQLTVPNLKAPPVRMGSAHTLETGDTVYTIGAPLGLDESFASGMVSQQRDRGDGSKLIQTTASISPGSSGGGLFDDHGDLVGITASSDTRGENLNFALPVDGISALPAYVAPATQPGAKTTNDWVIAATELDQKGDWNGLLDLTKHWTHAQPRNSAAWMGLARAYNGLGQYALARDAALQTLKLNPNNANAQYILGQIYDFGRGQPQNYAQAFTWYEKAAAEGSIDATFNLGAMYANGKGVPKDLVAAYALFGWVASRDSAYPNGSAYRDKDAATLTPAQIAAGQSLAGQMQKIGVLNALNAYAQEHKPPPQGSAVDAVTSTTDLQRGLQAYQKGDYAVALAVLKPLAQQGDGEGQFTLGEMYYRGQGVSKDFSAARDWFASAALQRNYIPAQAMLGIMYFHGEGLPKDYVAAYALLNRAASSSESNREVIGDLAVVTGKMTAAQIGDGKALTSQMQHIGVMAALNAHGQANRRSPK